VVSGWPLSTPSSDRNISCLCLDDHLDAGNETDRRVSREGNQEVMTGSARKRVTRPFEAGRRTGGRPHDSFVIARTPGLDVHRSAAGSGARLIPSPASLSASQTRTGESRFGVTELGDVFPESGGSSVRLTRGRHSMSVLSAGAKRWVLAPASWRTLMQSSLA